MDQTRTKISFGSLVGWAGGEVLLLIMIFVFVLLLLRVVLLLLLWWRSCLSCSRRICMYKHKYCNTVHIPSLGSTLVHVLLLVSLENENISALELALRHILFVFLLFAEVAFCLLFSYYTRSKNIYISIFIRGDTSFFFFCVLRRQIIDLFYEQQVLYIFFCLVADRLSTYF